MFLVILVGLVLACSPNDPIDKIVAAARKDPSFGSGMFTPIIAPENTLPLNVAAIALGESTTNLLVLEAKQVVIGVDNQEIIAPGTTSYTALLVRTRYRGDKVVLMQFDKRMRDWWWRVYDDKGVSP